MTGGGKTGTAASEQASSTPPIVISAADLSGAFQQNEAKAKLTYDGHPLEVSGKVKAIDLNIGDEPVIHLRGSGDAYGMGVNNDGKMTDVDVGGLSKETAATIDKGQTLTVICTGVDEVMGSPQLSDCNVKSN